MKNIKELIEKAQAGDCKAKYELATCYYFGEGVEKDYEKAIELFKSIANLEEEDYDGDWDNLYWDVDLAKYLMAQRLKKIIKYSSLRCVQCVGVFRQSSPHICVFRPR